MLRESAALAAHHGAYWQTHLSEDAGEIDEVRRLFPEAHDYLDVYDRAGALGTRTILAHAIHLSEREVDAHRRSRVRVAHCPASNLFLSSGLMPLGAYRRPAWRSGWAATSPPGPEISMFTVMRAGAVTQRVLELTGRADRSRGRRGVEWLRLATLDGARALGLEAQIGSLEAGKEADLIAIDPRLTTPLPGDEPPLAVGGRRDEPARCSGRTRTWCAARGCAGACSPGRRGWTASARLSRMDRVIQLLINAARAVRGRADRRRTSTSPSTGRTPG